jgi:hypothetical protein
MAERFSLVLSGVENRGESAGKKAKNFACTLLKYSIEPVSLFRTTRPI